MCIALAALGVAHVDRGKDHRNSIVGDQAPRLVGDSRGEDMGHRREVCPWCRTHQRRAEGRSVDRGRNRSAVASEGERLMSVERRIVLVCDDCGARAMPQDQIGRTQPVRDARVQLAVHGWTHGSRLVSCSRGSSRRWRRDADWCPACSQMARPGNGDVIGASR